MKVMFKCLHGRVALVTGSTSGIGLGIARGLAAQGCHVILTGFGSDAIISQLEEEIKRTFSVKCMHIHADLAEVSDIQRMCDTIQEIYPGSIDILVNNAGIQHKSCIEDLDVVVWQKILDVMLTAPFYLIKMLLPAMKDKGWGRIVNISSAMGLVGRELGSAYCAAKHGLVGLTKVVALETARSGVTCNAVCPGYVNTPLLQSTIEKMADTNRTTEAETKKQLLSPQPSGAFVEISQVADLVVFLCSDSASQMTGTALPVDGGFTAK